MSNNWTKLLLFKGTNKNSVGLDAKLQRHLMAAKSMYIKGNNTKSKMPMTGKTDPSQNGKRR